MSRFRFNTEDLVKLRVAGSLGPFTESMLSLRLFHSERPSVMADGWRRTIPQASRPNTLPLLALSPLTPFIDLHTLVGEAATIDEALDRLRETRQAPLAAELAPLRKRHEGAPAWVRAWVDDLTHAEPRALGTLARLTDEYFRAAVEPHWENISRYLEAERTRLGRVMANGGVDALLGSLHPGIRWQAPYLELAPGPYRGHDKTRVLDGRSLVIVPSVFSMDAPHVLASEADRSLPFVLLYPALRDAADAAALWAPSQPGTPRRLGPLLGHTRASVLEILAEASTSTTDLARQLGISPATASHHVGTLRTSGLIQSSRHGMTVEHRITPLGAGLVDGRRPSVM